MDQATHNKIVSFIWGIADDVLRDLFNTPHTARLAHDQALAKAAQGSVKDYTQFYKQFVENDEFKRFVGDMVFAMTNSRSPGATPPAGNV